LTLAQVLAWADDHHARTGEWPGTYSGHVLANLNEKWRNLDNALRYGLRTLPDGSSLAQLLAEERGVRNVKGLPPLTEEQILGWAREHRLRTRRWPTEDSGPVSGTDGEVWNNVNQALRDGTRGLAGGDSLARLLARRLRARNRSSVPRLTEALIGEWAR